MLSLWGVLAFLYAVAFWLLILAFVAVVIGGVKTYWKNQVDNDMLGELKSTLALVPTVEPDTTGPDGEPDWHHHVSRHIDERAKDIRKNLETLGARFGLVSNADAEEPHASQEHEPLMSLEDGDESEHNGEWDEHTRSPPPMVNGMDVPPSPARHVRSRSHSPSFLRSNGAASRRHSTNPGHQRGATAMVGVSNRELDRRDRHSHDDIRIPLSTKAAISSPGSSPHPRKSKHTSRKHSRSHSRGITTRSVKSTLSRHKHHKHKRHGSILKGRRSSSADNISAIQSPTLTIKSAPPTEVLIESPKSSPKHTVDVVEETHDELAMTLYNKLLAAVRTYTGSTEQNALLSALIADQVKAGALLQFQADVLLQIMAKQHRKASSDTGTPMRIAKSALYVPSSHESDSLADVSPIKTVDESQFLDTASDDDNKHDQATSTIVDASLQNMSVILNQSSAWPPALPEEAVNMMRFEYWQRIAGQPDGYLRLLSMRLSGDDVAPQTAARKPTTAPHTDVNRLEALLTQRDCTRQRIAREVFRRTRGLSDPMASEVAARLENITAKLHARVRAVGSAPRKDAFSTNQTMDMSSLIISHHHHHHHKHTHHSNKQTDYGVSPGPASGSQGPAKAHDNPATTDPPRNGTTGVNGGNTKPTRPHQSKSGERSHSGKAEPGTGVIPNTNTDDADNHTNASTSTANNNSALTTE